MRFFISLSLLFPLCSLVTPCAYAETSIAETPLVDFTKDVIPDFVRFNFTQPVAKDAEKGLTVRFDQAEWPNLFLQAPEQKWDWSDFDGIGVLVYNPADAAVNVALRLDNEGADGMNACNTFSDAVPAQQTYRVQMAFKRTKSNGKLWGMRGLPPVEISSGNGDPLDLKAITAFQLFLSHPEDLTTLCFKKIFLYKCDGSGNITTQLPFIDTFGQYKHADWPGKLHSEEELKSRLEEEAAVLASAAAMPGRDKFGGWADGPKREATGWFRTEEVDEKWWLITPEGSLFFSLGIDCVGTGEYTFVEQRDAWFDWLPDKEDPLFGKLYGQVRQAHSMADPIDGTGAIFNFYGANLIRKYGEMWREPWRNTVYKRLQHWGFNTVANWSQADIVEHSPLPFTACTSLGNVRLIEASQGYWSKIIDVFDESFETTVEAAVGYIAQKYADNPLCIGYFVDNELSWEGVVNGVLASTREQPARQDFIQFLEERYETMDELNKAWKTEFDGWDNLRRPKKANKTAQADFDDYLHHYATRYFSVIQDAVNRLAPNQLYLGCRFSLAPEPVVRACAEIIDVVSFNLYYRSIALDKWNGENKLGKPLIIGEFHFGALDRGMFHTGLVSTENQAARAQHYYDYVQSVIDHPGFVGCHWFQFVDEPVTGRWLDGENYNIGFVDVTDTPYPELTAAAQAIHRDVYTKRYGKE